MMTTIFAILIAISGIVQGWKRSNRSQAVKYAPAEAAQRQIRQDDEATEAEREATRRDAQKERVRFVDSETGEVIS